MRCVGIDLGGTAIKAGAVSSDGRVLERRSAPTGLERGERHVLDTIANLARELGVEGGLGLGVPGLIDRERGCITACPNLKAMERVPLRSELAKRLGLAPEREGVDQHLAGDPAARPDDEHSRRELSEAVDVPLGGDDVVGRLRPAAEADDGPRAGLPDEGVDDLSLSLVAEAETDAGDETGELRHPPASPPRSVTVRYCSHAAAASAKRRRQIPSLRRNVR